MRVWLRLALRGPVIRRALGYALVVGPVLIAINHGGALIRWEIDGQRWLQMGLTMLVPYCVSTLSSVGAMRADETGESERARPH